MESIDVMHINIVKELRAWSTVPVIFLSSLLPAEDILAISVAGANDYVNKPFSEMELLTLVRLVLRLHNAADLRNTI